MTHATNPAPAGSQPGRAPSAAAPLSAVLAITFVSSIGTGVVTNGVFFLTKSGFGFSDLDNYWLALALGVTYILAARFSHAAVEFLNRRGLSTRGVMLWTLSLMGALGVLPLIATRLGPSGSWLVWAMVVLYSPLTGVLWPVVESFLSGARQGEELRKAAGIWNATWSGAIIVSYFGMSGLVEKWPSLVVLALGVMHVVTVLWVLKLPREPGAHAPEHHEPHPPIYATLLTTFRTLLPTGYIMLSAMSPYLPGAMQRMGVGATAAVQLAASWLVARAITFWLMGRAQSWHGKWWPAVVGATLVFTGFGVTVVTPGFLKGTAGVAVQVAGLVVFGVGMAIVYSGAVYYALEVGRAEVEAGGTHESLVGVGYTIGPLCPLMAELARQRGWLGEQNFEVAVFGAAGAVSLAMAAVVARQVIRHTATR
ncbi:MAG: MFS transporter [Phycisphaerales bacterium]|nr:MFS transporter [Phycisphaerales bacterium]